MQDDEKKVEGTLEERYHYEMDVTGIYGTPLQNVDGKKVVFEHEVINAIEERDKRIKAFIRSEIALAERRGAERVRDAVLAVRCFSMKHRQNPDMKGCYWCEEFRYQAINAANDIKNAAVRAVPDADPTDRKVYEPR